MQIDRPDIIDNDEDVEKLKGIFGIKDELKPEKPKRLEELEKIANG